MGVRPLFAQPSQAICPLCTREQAPCGLGINCQCISGDWHGFSISCACLQKDWRLNSRCLGQHKGSDDGYCLGNGPLWRWVGDRTLGRESLINDCWFLPWGAETVLLQTKACFSAGCREVREDVLGAAEDSKCNALSSGSCWGQGPGAGAGQPNKGLQGWLSNLDLRVCTLTSNFLGQCLNSSRESRTLIFFVSPSFSLSVPTPVPPFISSSPLSLIFSFSQWAIFKGLFDISAPASRD